MKLSPRWPLASVLLFVTACRIAFADEPRSIVSLIPSDCVAFFTAKPYDAWMGDAATSAPSESTSAGAQLSAILTFLNAAGLIPDEGQVFADIAARLPLLGRYEHAMILQSVSSKIVQTSDVSDEPGSVSLRLRNLQSAVIFRTGGDNGEVIKHMNQVIGRYTNSDVAKLTTEKIDGHEFHRLADERLTGWAVWEWGSLGEFFVLTFGEGSFEEIARAYARTEPSLVDDPWFKEATVKTRGNRALAQWFISLSHLEECLHDVAGRRYQRAIQAIGADRMTHDLWTIGRRGRAMSWYRCYRRDGKDVTHAYSDPDSHPAELRRLIPDEANRFAIIHVPTRWLVDNLPRAWVEAQSEGHVEKITAAWDRLERETGIDINKSLIDHIGENVLIFDYPPHPLKIPVALTAAIEIDDQKTVQAAIDAILSAWSRYLDQRAERTKARLVRVYVKHDDDGVWYIQAGILGPALKVTKRFIVISWSPPALREALPYFEGRSANSSPRP